MPAPVYSTRFIHAQGFAGGFVSFFSAPSGFVTVVKCISITMGATVASEEASVQDGTGLKLFTAHATGTPTTEPQTFLWNGMYVMLVGESLGCSTALGTIADIVVSGYLLSA
jgi:hypothetical protein